MVGTPTISETTRKWIHVLVIADPIFHSQHLDLTDKFYHKSHIPLRVLMFRVTEELPWQSLESGVVNARKYAELTLE